jgi:hypothetical protein
MRNAADKGVKQKGGVREKLSKRELVGPGTYKYTCCNYMLKW